MKARSFELGAALSSNATGDPVPYRIPPHHLVTHCCVVGMTGSGKTGLSMVLVEETLRSRIPVLVVDVKGDLPNLLLALGTGSGDSYAPWIDAAGAARSHESVADIGAGVARERARQFAEWKLSDDDVTRHRETIAPRILTPGTTAGEPLNVLSSLDRPSPLWKCDPEAARLSLAATVSLVLRLVGRDADPTRSRDHIVLAHFAETRLRAGRPADLGALLHDLVEPPVDRIGAMALDDYMSERERKNLAAALNSLIASPTFDSWRHGSPLDIGAWLTPAADERTPLVIVSVAHLDDEERAVFLGLLFEELLAWVRTLPGTSNLRALVVFDEVYGFLPPHPANPPAKRPLLTLMKQARAFGVGMLLATQNPMDVDYRALSNAGLWFVGRLQTDADRERVVEGMSGASGNGGSVDPKVLDERLKALAPRWFYVRDVHASPNTALLNTRPTLAWMRGPMTRTEIRLLQTEFGPGERRGRVTVRLETAVGIEAIAGSGAQA